MSKPVTHTGAYASDRNLAAQPEGTVDKRWLAIGRTAIEQGFMAVNRSIFKPGRVVLPDEVP